MLGTSISNFLSLAVVLPALSTAQQTPMALLEKFFSPSGITDKKAIYTGEMLRYVDGPTMGEDLGKGVNKSFRVLTANESSAVYAVRVTSPTLAQDWYVFLRKTGSVWQIQALRTLAQTALIELVANQLRKKPNRTPEEEWRLKNGELTLSSDENLKAHLKNNLPAFEALVATVRTATEDNASAAAKPLLLTSVRTAPTKYIHFTIGGVQDNLVGYLYVPADVPPPRMDPDDIIYLEKVTDHWYVFKTT